MKLAVELEGVGAAVKFVRASTDANCLDQEYRTCPHGHGGEYLILDFDTGAGHNWNAFEGCCVAAGKWYAVWPSKKADSDLDMLRKLNVQQFWVTPLVDPGGNPIPPGASGWGVVIVCDEEPKP